nr:ATP-binding protein [uncultured Methanospirillum sp.]
MIHSLISFLFPDYEPGSRTCSLLMRRKLVLPILFLILVLAILFIQYNSQMMLNSYNEVEEGGTNFSLLAIKSVILVHAETLEKTTLDYATWDETAGYIKEPTDLYIYKNLQVRSLKNLGITYVGISDQEGKTLYLRQYDPDTYAEINPVILPVELSSSFNTSDNSRTSLVYANETLLLVSLAGISNSEATLPSSGTFIFGTPLERDITKKVHELTLDESAIHIISPVSTGGVTPVFDIADGATATLGEQNESWKSGTLSFTDPSSSSILQISISGDKYLLTQGRTFVSAYFLRSVLFCLVAITLGILIIFFLFRRHDLARSQIIAQNNELAALKERREILDKFHQVLDQYLYAGLESEQNIPLITKTAGSMLKTEAAFYTRFEDGSYSLVSSWPDAGGRVHAWLAEFFLSQPELPDSAFCSGGDIVISVDDLPEEGRNLLKAVYPRVRMIVSRGISVSGNQAGDLSLLLSGEEPESEVNQIMLDLIVHALSGEENRRRTKAALKRRDILLEAIGYSAAQVIGDLSASSIIEILHKIVMKMGVSEAHYFAWDTPAGDPVLTHDYVWVEEAADFTEDQLAWTELLESPFSPMIFEMHDAVAGPAEKFPVQQKFLADHGIRSIALIPFISRKETRGVLILADRARERSWHTSELEALRIAADLLMAALVRIDSEEEHKRRDENFQQFFNHLNDFVFILDSDGRIITANLFAQQETGIRASDMRGMRLSGLFTSRWMDTPLSPEGGRIPAQERTAVLLTIEGREIPVEIRYLAGIWNGNQAVFCICKDISHLKRSEHKFATAFRSSQVLHAIWSLREERLIDANETFFETTGYIAKEILRSTHWSEYGIIDPGLFRHIRETILTEGSVRDLELPLRTKNGEMRQGSLFGALIEIDADPCILFSIVDITERKRAEQKVQDLLKELSASNKGLHDFAHIVAHDLKDPLRGIFSLASWIGEDYQEQIGPDGVRYVGMITEQVQRMYQLIDGILAYSQAGIVREDRIPVSISLVIVEVLQILSPPPSVQIIIGDDMPVITAERTKIQQVFQNLIGNSLTHLNRDDGEIRISAHPASDKDGTPLESGACGSESSPEFWEFEIGDNGPGIDPSLHESIFEIFTSYPSHDGKKSSGIGLSIVKRIVETSGGSIWVKSVPGGGATFCFTIKNMTGSSHDAGMYGGEAGY